MSEENNTINSVNPRPARNDDVVTQIVAEKVCDMLMEWLPTCGDNNSDRQEILKHAKELVSYRCRDGYESAKYLDDYYGYLPDSELVEMLDGVGSIVSDVHDKAVCNWAASNNIQPKYNVGDKIKFKRHNKEIITGEIINVSMKTQTYIVFCESEGHVRSGCGTLGIYVEWENVLE